MVLSVTGAAADEARGSRLKYAFDAGVTYLCLASESEFDTYPEGLIESEGETRNYVLVLPRAGIGPRISKRWTLLAYEEPRVGFPGHVVLLVNNVGMEVTRQFLGQQRPLLIAVAVGYACIRFPFSADWNRYFPKDGVECSLSAAYRFCKHTGVRLRLGYTSMRHTGVISHWQNGESEYVERYRGLVLGVSLFTTNL